MSEQWWRQEKTRFFWGQWGHLLPESYRKPGPPMEELLKKLSQIGATVFVESMSNADVHHSGASW